MEGDAGKAASNRLSAEMSKQETVKGKKMEGFIRSIALTAYE